MEYQLGGGKLTRNTVLSRPDPNCGLVLQGFSSHFLPGVSECVTYEAAGFWVVGGRGP